MDVKRNIMKDRNSESTDSTLKVNYVVDFGKNFTQRKIRLNPVLFKHNKLNISNNRYKISDLRKEEFHSYSNENMDFFRLDHVSECDRNNYHNIFMDKLKPINRNANFQKFNEIGKRIKYLDYLKENRLLNQNKKILRNIYSDKEIETYKMRKKYYTKEVENNILPDINKNNSNNYPSNHNLNNETIDYDRDFFKNRIISQFKNHRKEQLNNSDLSYLSNRYIKKPFKGYSNSSITNINDYNIQEGDKNLYPERNKMKLRPTIQNNYTNSEEINRLYNMDRKMNYDETPFYLAYNEINQNGGFKKKGGDISRYDKIRQNHMYYNNSKNILDKNEYRDMKNIISRNFHKKKFNSVEF